MERLKKSWLCILLILIYCTCFKYAYSQPYNEEKVAWVEGTFGPSYTHAIGGGASVNFFLSRYNLISFGFHMSSSLRGDSSAPYTSDIALMFGRGYAGKLFLVSASAGISLSTGYYYSDTYSSLGFDLRKDFVSPAIPLQFRVLFTPVRYVGIGAQVFHSFNFHNSQGYIGGVIAVGVLREKEKAGPFD
jgi:hypothetical protein